MRPSIGLIILLLAEPAVAALLVKDVEEHILHGADSKLDPAEPRGILQDEWPELCTSEAVSERPDWPAVAIAPIVRARGSPGIPWPVRPPAGASAPGLGLGKPASFNPGRLENAVVKEPTHRIQGPVSPHR